MWNTVQCKLAYRNLVVFPKKHSIYVSKIVIVFVGAVVPKDIDIRIATGVDLVDVINHFMRIHPVIHAPSEHQECCNHTKQPMSYWYCDIHCPANVLVSRTGPLTFKKTNRSLPGVGWTRWLCAFIHLSCWKNLWRSTMLSTGTFQLHAY